MEKFGLFNEFPSVPTSEWEATIEKDLKGKDYAKSLIWRTYEGIEVKPYYRSADLEETVIKAGKPGEFPFIRGIKPDNDWFVRQDIFVNDLQEANKKALNLLNKGVNSLGFYFDCCKKIDSTQLSLLLRGICPEAIETNFVCGCRNCNCIEPFIDFLKSGNWSGEKIIASSAVDPIGSFSLKGIFEEGSEEEAFSGLKQLVEKSLFLPFFRVIGIHGKFFGNSGSSVVQELAFSLATGSEYLSKLTELGLSPEAIASKIKFNFSLSNNYFLEIAKLRAARLLWSKIVEAYHPADLNSAGMVIHCETGTFNKTIYDPYVNLLRTQTEAMSATLGGVHSLTILPHDHVFGNPSEFSERIARNQQILLKEESHFDKIADPAAGSYYIEALTTSISEAAWQLFLRVEATGGYLAALKAGFIQTQINETARKKRQNLAARRENLLGTNQFPNPDDAIKTNLNPSVFLPADFTEQGAEIETLKPFRLAQSFETLRYNTDLYALSHKRPRVFLLTYGNLAMRKARAQFSTNFFAVAGFHVTDNNGFLSAEEGVSAARADNADIVVVCSSDEEYADFVPAVAELIKNEILVVAGNPECRPALESEGVKNFIHVRSNLPAELKSFQELIGIK